MIFYINNHVICEQRQFYSFFLNQCIFCFFFPPQALSLTVSQIWRAVLPDKEFSVDRFYFSPCTLNISVYWLLAYKDSAEKLPMFTKDPLYMTSIFSCAAFRIFSLSLVFNSVIIKCLEVSLFWFILLQVH